MAFFAERLEKIREIMLERKTVDVTTLCKILDVSDVTIRKDLDRLEEEKFLTKIHGGAVLSEGVDDRYFQTKDSFPYYKEKQKIAEEAAKLIDTFDNIFIGPGSSCYLFAKMLFGHRNVRVVTNNINCLGILYNSVKKVNVIGGEIGHRDDMLFSSGTDGFPELDGVFLNKAIVTYNGVTPDGGFTLDEMVLVNLYEKMFSISKEVIILASSNKIGHHSMYRSADLSRADYFITTASMDAHLKEGFEQGQVRVVQV
jgi:DeoR family transcriptional regulator, fructose operon transcriptional repressor